MRKQLLATAAAVAMLTAPSLASAEGMKGGEQPKASAGAQTETHAPAKVDDKAKAGAKAEMKADQGKAAQDKSKAAQDKSQDKSKPSTAQSNQPAGSKRETTGQGGSQSTQSQQPQRQPSNAQSGTQQQPNAQQRSTTQQGAQGQTGSSASQTTGAAPSSGGVNLTSEQKTKIRTTVLQSSSAPKIEKTKINFSLNIGTVVPRSVHVVAVPVTLVEIHPAWRGYSYFVVGDEIVIVEPSTLKIVAVVVV